MSNVSGCGCNEKKTPCCTTKPTVQCNPCTGEVKIPYDCPIIPKRQEQFVVVKQCAAPAQNPCELPYQCCQRRRCVPPKCKTICYTCQPKREDCEPCKPRCYELAYLDSFDKFDVGTCPDSHWIFYSNGDDFVANDGKREIKRDGLVITASPFTVTYPPGNIVGPVKNGDLDHYKTAIILNSEFEVRECGQIFAETCVSGLVNTGDWEENYADYVYSPKFDFRLAYVAAITAWDFENAGYYEVALTNDVVVATYSRTLAERDDFGGGGGNYAAFTAAKLIGRRTGNEGLKDFVKTGIAISGSNRTVSYYLEGNKVHEFANLGNAPDPELVVLDYGGSNENVVPTVVSFGFGTGDLLDGTIPSFSSAKKDPDYLLRKLAKLTTTETINPYRSSPRAEIDPIPAAVSEPAREDRLYGQGAILKIKQIKIEYQC